MNQLKEQKKTEQEPKQKGNPKKNRIAKSFIDVINGSFLTRESAISSLPYIFFMAFICLCYIANGYYAEDSVRAINNIGSELKELKTEYIITKSDLMFNSKQSQVAKSLEEYGIKESVVPPLKIVVTKKENKL
jgi:hypothetical protein